MAGQARPGARPRSRRLPGSALLRPATQVHHLTYAHLGDELLFELISVCDDCRKRIHHSEQIADTTDSARPSYDADGNPLNYDEEDEEGI